MTLNNSTKLFLVIAVQLLVLWSIIFYKLVILHNGTLVVLAIKPVDPRDVFRGDYVTFKYDIADIDSYLLNESTKYKKGDTVYVVLNDTNTTYQMVERVVKEKPKTEELFLKGEVTAVNNPTANNNQDTFDNDRGGIEVRFGIEQFYIPEGTGSQADFAGHNMTAAVMVDSNGKAVLKQIYMDGKIWPY